MGSTPGALPALVVIAAVAVLLVLSVRQARTRDLARVEVRDGAVVVLPRGALAVVALTRTLVVPLEHVVTADLVPGFEAPVTGSWKLAGGPFGSVAAGTFVGEWGRAFLLVGGASTSLRLVLRDHAYDLVVIDTPRAADVARQVRAALR